MKNRRALVCPSVAPLFVAITLAQTFPMQAQIVTSVSTSVASPASLGTIVTWTATATGSQSGNVWYRFRVRELNAIPMAAHEIGGLRIPPTGIYPGLRMIQDFGPMNTLAWTASQHEGNYQMEVSAEDNDTGAISTVMSDFQFTPLVTGSAPVINPTANPLVFLYSAAACPAGSTMSVQFQTPGGLSQSTNSKPCNGRNTMNFYLAGMLAQTTYSVQQTVQTGANTVAGPTLTLTTGAVPSSFIFAARTVEIPPPASFPNPVILDSRFGFPAATDNMGNVLWYALPSVSMISYP
ncbi:MAG TPA: hypothetical protein VME43_16280, partial [Bryobacteraceae bacterium]|nr:hypothetical protein [Bryobacteraceae bacterium]